MLCAVGDLVEDVVVWLGAAIWRGTDTACTIYRRRGGSAANVAALAAQSGTPARFIGRVGDDPLGERLVAALTATGAEVLVQRSGRSGTIVVLVEPDGERTMLPDRAACTELAEVPEGWVAGATVLHLPFYSLAVEPIGTTAAVLAGAARRRGALVSVDASSVAVLEAAGRDAVQARLAQLEPDVLLANADEAAVLGLDRGGPVPAGLVVVKQGRDPVVLLHEGRREEVAVPPLRGVTDSTGAGDAFAAAFLPALVGGASPREAALAGIALAARVLTTPGASMTASPLRGGP